MPETKVLVVDLIEVTVFPLRMNGRVCAVTASPTLWKMNAEELWVVAAMSTVLPATELAIPAAPLITMSTSTALRQTWVVRSRSSVNTIISTDQL